jgi:NAD(P)-dependent dehydrogenase (short-subunit alcohol dehydrogenase family)
MRQYKPAAAETSLGGKIVIVTGSTQGLGEAFAQRAAYLDAAGIVVCGRNQEKGLRVAEQIENIGCPCLYVPADLAREEDCRRIVRQCDERFGRVDGLVNSAGLSSRGTLDDTTVPLWDQLFDINVRAPFILMQEAARVMRREGVRGSIVNIITMGSYGGPPDLMAYCSSKAALSILTKNVAYQLQPDRIRVNGINIGWTETEGEHTVQRATGQPDDWLARAAAERPIGRLLEPRDIAPLLTYLLSDLAEMVTGSVIDFDQTVNGPYGEHTVPGTR